jgi:hypothetical protein
MSPLSLSHSRSHSLFPLSQVMTYELFLSAIIHAASLLKRPEVPFLSEGLREYIMKVRDLFSSQDLILEGAGGSCVHLQPGGW